MTDEALRGGAAGWLRVLVLIAGVQVLFWAILALIGERAQEHTYMQAHEVRDVYVKVLPGLAPDFGPADPKNRQGFPFFPSECYRGYKSPAHQFTFFVRAEAFADRGLYIPWVSDNFQAYANGRLITPASGHFSLTPSREERRPHLVGISADLMAPGENRIDLVVTRTGCAPYVETAYVGPLEPFKAYERHMVLLGHYVPIITAVAGGLVALVALCLLPISSYSPLFGSLAAFMAALSLRAFAFVWAGNGLDYTTFLTIIYLVHYLALATAGFFVQAWARQPVYHVKWIVAAFGVFFAAPVTVWAMNGDIYGLLTNILNPAAVIALTGYTMWSLYHLHRTRPVEAKRAVILASLFVVSEIYDALVVILNIRRFIDAAYYLPIVLIIAVAGQMATRGYRLYREAEAGKADLARQIAEKEKDIRRSYALLHEQEKVNAIHTERQRLIRDMHDGIGGHLVSLMLQLKGQDLPREHVQSQVQAAIDDLRLVIDSMDSVGDSLDIALAIFRERLQPRLKAAGIELEWLNRIDGGVHGFRPQEILHVYRILQEGVTNTLKYAEATRVSLSLSADGERICIALSDNGKGFDMAAKTSGRRGLNHMHKRARLLGAGLTMTSDHNVGTAIGIFIPRPAFVSGEQNRLEDQAVDSETA